MTPHFMTDLQGAKHEVELTYPAGRRPPHFPRGDEFDGVIDFDRVTRDPAHPTRFLPAYDSGDHLHPNDLGYQAMGNAVPLELFRALNSRSRESGNPYRAAEIAEYAEQTKVPAPAPRYGSPLSRGRPATDVLPARY
jgi:hypothetical protein